MQCQSCYWLGPCNISFSIANSWKTVGKPAKVSGVDGPRIERIDNFSAVDFYRHYLGDHSEPAREFLLSVYKDDEHTYLRAPIEYNADGSITFSESIPEGATVQLTEAFREVMIEDTKTSSNQVTRPISSICAFPCNGVFMRIPQGSTRTPVWNRNLKY